MKGKNSPETMGEISPAESPILLQGKLLGLLVFEDPSQGFPVPEADSKISYAVHKDGMSMFILA